MCLEFIYLKHTHIHYIISEMYAPAYIPQGMKKYMSIMKIGALFNLNIYPHTGREKNKLPRDRRS